MKGAPEHTKDSWRMSLYTTGSLTLSDDHGSSCEAVDPLIMEHGAKDRMLAASILVATKNQSRAADF